MEDIDFTNFRFLRLVATVIVTDSDVPSVTLTAGYVLLLPSLLT